jgi:hypothetical protein
MLFLVADGELVPFGQPQREHAKVFRDRLAIDRDFEVAGKLIEREINAVLLLNPNHETELQRLRFFLRRKPQINPAPGTTITVQSHCQLLPINVLVANQALTWT